MATKIFDDKWREKSLKSEPKPSLWPYLGLLFAVLFGAGCNSTKVLTDPILGPDHVVQNVYRREPMLPGNFRRVAVLPLSVNSTEAGDVSAREILDSAFQSELNKTARFELFFVDPVQLQRWSGRERWDDFEELPEGFLKTVAERAGCDGVLFTRVTQFHGYPPLVIGWRMRLVNNNGEALWSADELFDAAEEAVSNSARRYDRAHVRNNPVLEDSRTILLSPRKFGQYSLASLFATLPTR